MWHFLFVVVCSPACVRRTEMLKRKATGARSSCDLEMEAASVCLRTQAVGHERRKTQLARRAEPIHVHYTSRALEWLLLQNMFIDTLQNELVALAILETVTFGWKYDPGLLSDCTDHGKSLWGLTSTTDTCMFVACECLHTPRFNRYLDQASAVEPGTHLMPEGLHVRTTYCSILRCPPCPL